MLLDSAGLCITSSAQPATSAVSTATLNMVGHASPQIDMDQAALDQASLDAADAGMKPPLPPQAYPASRVATLYGRPKWDRIFADVAAAHPRKRVGVFVCGPKVQMFHAVEHNHATYASTLTEILEPKELIGILQTLLHDNPACVQQNRTKTRTSVFDGNPAARTSL